MKPSERIREIQISLNKYKFLKDYEVIGIPIIQYLDEEADRKNWGPSPALDLVSLLKEIEHQKFTAQNHAIRLEKKE